MYRKSLLYFFYELRGRALIVKYLVELKFERVISIKEYDNIRKKEIWSKTKFEKFSLVKRQKDIRNKLKENKWKYKRIY